MASTNVKSKQALIVKRQPRESARAVQASLDYCKLGYNRSIDKLLKLYQEQRQNDGQETPTTSISTLLQWSRQYQWVQRARAYDEEQQRKAEGYARRRMSTGVALPHKRVEKLANWLKKLEDELENGSLWLPDVKQIGSGEYAEKIELRRYNSALISDLRGLLDDLAKETGGRKQKQEVEITGLADFLAQAHRNGFQPPPKPAFDYDEARFIDEPDDDEP